jgi:hypothetical protein
MPSPNPQPPIPDLHQNSLPQNDNKFTKATNKKEDREQTLETLLKHFDSKPKSKKTEKKKKKKKKKNVKSNPRRLDEEQTS